MHLGSNIRAASLACGQNVMCKSICMGYCGVGYASHLVTLKVASAILLSVTIMCLLQNTNPLYQSPEMKYENVAYGKE